MVRLVGDSRGLVPSWVQLRRRVRGKSEGLETRTLAETANQLGHADINVTAKVLGRKTAPATAAEIIVLSDPDEEPASQPVEVA